MSVVKWVDNKAVTLASCWAAISSLKRSGVAPKRSKGESLAKHCLVMQTLQKRR